MNDEELSKIVPVSLTVLEINTLISLISTTKLGGTIDDLPKGLATLTSLRERLKAALPPGVSIPVEPTPPPSIPQNGKHRRR